MTDRSLSITLHDGQARHLWFWSFLLLTGLLSSTILLKVGEVQYLELLFALQALLLALHFLASGMKVRLARVTLTTGLLYITFIVVAFGLALLALSRDFYLPEGLSFLKHPMWLTAARSVELLTDMTAMLYLVEVFRSRRDALLFTTKVYFSAGVASALYSIVTFPLNYFFSMDLGTYHSDHRMRGFYNEGGPNGLYMLSVVLVGYALYRTRAATQKYLRYGILLAITALLGSKSKSAFTCALLILLVNVLLTRGLVTKVAVVSLLVVTGVTANYLFNIDDQIRLIMANSHTYEYLSRLQAKNGNVVSGRVAGIFIVPRMLAAHPWTGVGWGNYGLVRNDPVYRGASAWSIAYDEPGLGLGDNAAELGIPLTLFLLFCLLYPFLYLRLKRSPVYVQNIALLMVMVHICGAQLNIIYPWVAGAIAIGLSYYVSEPAREQLQAVNQGAGRLLPAVQ